MYSRFGWDLLCHHEKQHIYTSLECCVHHVQKGNRLDWLTSCACSERCSVDEVQTANQANAPNGTCCILLLRTPIVRVSVAKAHRRWSFLRVVCWACCGLFVGVFYSDAEMNLQFRLLIARHKVMVVQPRTGRNIDLMTFDTIKYHHYTRASKKAVLFGRSLVKHPSLRLQKAASQLTSRKEAPEAGKRRVRSKSTRVCDSKTRLEGWLEQSCTKVSN